MFKNLLQLYTLATCLICIVCVLIFGSFALNNVVNIAFPSYQHVYETHATNEDYKAIRLRKPGVSEEEKTRFKNLSEEEITKMREKENERILHRRSRQETGSLIRSVLHLLLALGVFGIHWRIYKKTSA